MEPTRRYSLAELEAGICDIVSEAFAIKRAKIHPGSRLIKDLNIDSIDFLDLTFRIEKKISISLPYEDQDMLCKAVFIRKDHRISDLAEMAYLRQGCGLRTRAPFWSKKKMPTESFAGRFTQLGGRWGSDGRIGGALFESVGKNRFGYVSLRRRTDGMICVQVPAAEVAIGSENAMPDERPFYRVQLDEFLIDQEPVSTTAYCRFLNSIGPVDQAMLQQWFALESDDQRQMHELLRQTADGWTPLLGTERMPMMLVSWFGADAYSRWANRIEWRNESDAGSFLPSEAQWEYAARGIELRMYPWGDDEPTQERARFSQFSPGKTYLPDQLPMADVNVELGMSPFGLHHMAGNVWQWCRDWYAPHIRSERGGSWVGPGFLCRSSYRRGRVPSAKGRCLGFRCISDPPVLTANV